MLCGSRNPTEPTTQLLIRLVLPFRRRIDHLADLGDLGSRETAHLRVLTDDLRISPEVDEERLVVGDVGFDPLDVATKLAQHPIRFCRSPAKLFALEGANLRDISLNNELAQRHNPPPWCGLLDKTALFAASASFNYLVGAG